MPVDDADREFLGSLTLLYVEDEEVVREHTARFLERRVGRLVLAGDGRQAIERFDAEKPDLVASDILMPVMDGLALATALRERSPRTPVILITAFEKTEYLRRAIEARVHRYVLKPVDPDQLDEALLDCARQVRAERQLELDRRREVELLQARHAAAIGVLAGGLAHDYNNLLQQVMTATELAGESWGIGDDPTRMLQMAKNGLREAARLGGRLELLYKDTRGEYHTAPIGALLQEQVARGLAGTRCTAQFTLAPELPPLSHHPGKLGEVFGALARNGAEAMDGAGVLSVSAGIEDLPVSNAWRLPGGTYVHVVFRDTGRGIAPELLASIFEPYVSTKARSSTKGMGLSLAIARAVLTMHHGAISAESSPGDTRFHLYLPVGDASSRQSR